MQMKKIIIANWKMNPISLKEAEKLFSILAKKLKNKNTQIIICPPFVYLEKLNRISKRIFLGAQNASFIDKGAFTGEVSGEMLESVGVKYVILGHSERRALGEDNVLINKKLKSVLSSGLVPILCVGEKDRDNNHEYFDVIKRQLQECLKGIKKELIPKILIAYEPVWAISTTVHRFDATAKDSEEMVIFIRKIISLLSSPMIAGKIRILYGGSVNERNAEEFLTRGSVDGLLVGKVSLDFKKFSKIVEICEALKN